ncbi:MAG: hypothetical protein Q8N55_03705, partial [bacterium]|nr:hypothetical protein [bacterium]
LEFGSKDRSREKMFEKASKILENFFRKKMFPQKDFYYVYGSLKGTTKEADGLVDLNLAQRGGECFYPLLVSQYLDLGVVCYKARKLSKKEKSGLLFS